MFKCMNLLLLPNIHDYTFVLFVLNPGHCSLKNQNQTNKQQQTCWTVTQSLVVLKNQQFVVIQLKKINDKNQIISVLYNYLQWPSFSNQKLSLSLALGKKEKLQYKILLPQPTVSPFSDLIIFIHKHIKNRTILTSKLLLTKYL